MANPPYSISKPASKKKIPYKKITEEIYKTKAKSFLEDALEALQDRASVRDVEEERSMARAVKIWNTLTDNNLGENDGWLFMICLKLARDSQGNFHRDDIVDLAGYAALYGESRSK